MEVSFSELKQKDVISVTDGKNLGKVCDVSFCFPENDVLGITVTGGKGFKLTRQDVFIPIKSVQKIGEDAVLVKLDPPEKDACQKKHSKNCEPDNCQPNRPCPPCPPRKCQPDRRSYEEYE